MAEEKIILRLLWQEEKLESAYQQIRWHIGAYAGVKLRDPSDADSKLCMGLKNA